MPLDYLRKCDPLLQAVIDRVGPLPERSTRPDDHFVALLRIIVGQQLSTKVATTIWNRFTAEFGEIPSTEIILTSTEDRLRSVGLSGAKARYLKSLAEHVANGELQIAKLELLSDEEIHTEITAVKGLGPWSADMFLMFHLVRPDILPVGDLGIREAVRRLYALEERPGPAELTEIAEKWRPHRTLACRYLWRSLDNEPG